MFRISIQDGMKFFFDVKDSIRWCLGKSVQIENTLVCTTQNRTRIVRHGDSSEDIDAWLSKIEDNGEKEYRSETTTTKLWLQAREIWNRSSDQESKGIKWRLKEGNVFVTSGKKKANVRRETSRGAILRQPCRFYLNGTCTRSPCEYRHPPECQVYWTEAGCKAGDKCLSPHLKVDEQPNKKAKERLLFPPNKIKRRQECCGICLNCTTFGLRLARLGCVGFSERKTVLGKPDAKSLGTDSKSTIHSVYATSSTFPGKDRIIAWKNTGQKSSSAKSLRFEIWGRVPWRDWKTTAMRP